MLRHSQRAKAKRVLVRETRNAHASVITDQRAFGVADKRKRDAVPVVQCFCGFDSMFDRPVRAGLPLSA